MITTRCGKLDAFIKFYKLDAFIKLHNIIIIVLVRDSEPCMVYTCYKHNAVMWIQSCKNDGILVTIMYIHACTWTVMKNHSALQLKQ